MERLDFDTTVKQFEALGSNAKVTLMYRLVQTMTPGTLRSVLQYAFRRLDKINAELPEGHPYRKERTRKGIVHEQITEKW